MSISYRERVSQLEAEYDRLFDEIEQRHGGVDYQGRLAALRREIEQTRKLATKFDRIRKATESTDSAQAAALIVEVVLADEEPDIHELAADFVEDELGRFDWMNNWRRVKEKMEAIPRIQAYLNYLGVRVDPLKIVNEIERMVRDVPGRWR